MTEQKKISRVNRFFRRAALIIGYPIAAVLVLGIIGLTGRYIQTELSSPPVSSEHLEYKQSYLQSVKAAPKSAPNVIVIFFDDLGWGDLSSYGNKVIDTPNIDQVAQEGLLMTDFYSASPVCTPSRAALLTGRYPPRTRTDRHVYFPDDHLVGKLRRMMGWANALPKEEITFAEVLGQAGYQTGMIGKWHLGDSKGYRPNDFGFESWYGVLFSNDMFPLNMYQNETVVIKDERVGSFLANERDEANPLAGKGIDQTELTQLYTDQAVAFLEQKGDRPFMLYLAHSFPHVPHYSSRDFANTSDGAPHKNKSLIVVPTNLPGISFSEKLDKLGMRSSDTAQIFFDNVRVPQRNLIGHEGAGFAMQMQQFQEERMYIAAMSLKSMDLCINETYDYTSQRQAFGKPLIANQVIQFRLSELQTEVELLRALVHQACDKYVHGEDVTRLASMAKLKSGRLSREVSDACLQYWGGMGFMWDNIVSRLYRDNRLGSIGGGADEIMLGIISKYMQQDYSTRA